MSDELDQGEAVAFILGSQPRLTEDDVWTVVNEIGAPPAEASEPLALELMRQTHPGLSPRVVQSVLTEWRAYADLAGQRDWNDDESDYINRFDD